MPVGINLATRPFSPYRITFKAKKVIHNSVLVSTPDLISMPALQATPKDPPVVLRENLDYTIEGGKITFIEGLFTLKEPAPPKLWAEIAILDNGSVIEQNFGRLVGLTQEALTNKNTKAPYLSAVKGLFYAMTTGPTVANIRLGLQIIMGLPFTEERGIILEIQDSFTVDSHGNSLGRLLIEDVDDKNKRTGFRRLYFYPTVLGLEVNPVTNHTYVVKDVVERFSPLSKGVEVQDYIKDPMWWVRALSGLEVLKYFTFKIIVDAEILDFNDVQYALEFIKKIKPSYTKVITTALISVHEDITEEDSVGGKTTLQFFDNPWGLEACNKATDDNSQGFVLWHLNSPPFETRTPRFLADVRTYREGSSIMVSSVKGWASSLTNDHNQGSLVRARAQVATSIMEGDLLAILPGQPGAPSTSPALYEIGAVVSDHVLQLLQSSSFMAPTTFDVTPLDVETFEYGERLKCCIVRRGSNPIIHGNDLQTVATSSIVTSSGALFKTNAVSPGDTLVIELGAGPTPNPNAGEYFIDAVIPFNQGPGGTTPPSITETQVLLKTQNGGSPTFEARGGQEFRVIRRDSLPKVVRGIHCYIDPGTGHMRLEARDPVLPGVPRDVFTPSMVGSVVEVSNAEYTSNNGPQVITGYLDCGTVALDLNTSLNSDTVAQAIIHF
jgi:hypothetical protein